MKNYQTYAILALLAMGCCAAEARYAIGGSRGGAGLSDTCSISFLPDPYTSCICNSTYCKISRGVQCGSTAGYQYNITAINSHDKGTCPTYGWSWITCTHTASWYELGVPYTFTAV
ncbi:MAG: hypothetical protein JW724_05205 [Candidatus Altiarchaeota archaeon]|nr:hypothetical protein [Candidatus Altiarchaeota archaeon]